MLTQTSDDRSDAIQKALISAEMHASKGQLSVALQEARQALTLDPKDENALDLARNLAQKLTLESCGSGPLTLIEAINATDIDADMETEALRTMLKELRCMIAAPEAKRVVLASESGGTDFIFRLLRRLKDVDRDLRLSVLHLCMDLTQCQDFDWALVRILDEDVVMLIEGFKDDQELCPLAWRCLVAMKLCGAMLDIAVMKVAWQVSLISVSAWRRHAAVRSFTELTMELPLDSLFDCFELYFRWISEHDSFDDKTYTTVWLAKMMQREREEAEMLPQMTSRLGPLYTSLFDEDRTITWALWLLHSCFSVSYALGNSLLTKEGVLGKMMDCLEFEAMDVQAEALQVLSQACSSKASLQLIASTCVPYLMTQMQSKDKGIRNVVAVILSKLSSLDSSLTSLKPEELCNVFLDTLLSTTNKYDAARKEGIEGLAFISQDPAVKEIIVSNEPALKSMLKMAESAPVPVKYGITIIFQNLTAFERRLSEKEQQILKIREFAKDTASARDDPRSKDPAVLARTTKLIKAGIIPALNAIASTESQNILDALANVYLSCAAVKESRGLLVQQGVVKPLLKLCQADSKEVDASEDDVVRLTIAQRAAQALARLAISLDPNLAFRNTAPSLVMPLIQLCKTRSSLAQFEALLALTNLASMQDESVMNAIRHHNGIQLFEELQFDENDRIQCAATEMLCNMVVHSDVMALYVGSKTGSTRMKLNLALCDAELFATRRAASGLIAMVCCTSEEFCRQLAKEERCLSILLGLLTAEHSELHLRVLAILTAWSALPDLKKVILGEKDILMAVANLFKSSPDPNVQGSAMELISRLK